MYLRKFWRRHATVRQFIWNFTISAVQASGSVLRYIKFHKAAQQTHVTRCETHDEGPKMKPSRFILYNCSCARNEICLKLTIPQVTYMAKRWQRWSTFYTWYRRFEPMPVAAGSKAARLFGMRVRIPPGTWMSVSCDCCVLSGRDLCVGLITRPESCWVWCVWVRSRSLEDEEALANGC
jgi:hypothetical protein